MYKHMNNPQSLPLHWGLFIFVFLHTGAFGRQVGLEKPNLYNPLTKPRVVLFLCERIRPLPLPLSTGEGISPFTGAIPLHRRGDTKRWVVAGRLSVF
jgi:hypothetical protein